MKCVYGNEDSQTVAFPYWSVILNLLKWQSSSWATRALYSIPVWDYCASILRRELCTFVESWILSSIHYIGSQYSLISTMSAPWKAENRHHTRRAVSKYRYSRSVAAMEGTSWAGSGHHTCIYAHPMSLWLSTHPRAVSISRKLTLAVLTSMSISIRPSGFCYFQIIQHQSQEVSLQELNLLLAFEELGANFGPEYTSNCPSRSGTSCLDSRNLW